MPRFRPKGVLERTAAADLWKHTLSKIASVYGRLVYLSALRDANSGLYRHHGLSTAFGREESSKTLKESHDEVFREWLNLPMSERSVDLRAYLAGLEEAPELVLDEWLRSKAYKNHAPASASEAQKKHFARDLRPLLEVLRNDFADASHTRNSSRPA